MEREKLLNRGFTLVLLGNFLLYFSFYTLLPALPLYMQDTYNATPTQIGVVLSLYTITALIIRPFAGFLIDSLPRKTMQQLFYAGFALMFCTYLFNSNIYIFAAIRAIHGLFFGMITVANMTVAIDVLNPTRRSEGLGYYGISNNIGMALGPSLSFITLHHFESYNAIFTLALISCIIGFALIWQIKIPTQHNKPKLKELRNEKISFDRFFLIKGIPNSIMFALVAFGHGVVLTYLAVYARDEVGIENGVGGFFILLAIGLIAARLSTGKLLRKGKYIELVTIGIIALIAIYVAFVAIKTEAVFYTCALLFGYSYGLICPPVQAMFVNLAPNNRRGTASSTYFTSWDIGAGIGVVLGGIIADIDSYSAAIYFSAALIVVALIQFRKHATPHYLNNRVSKH